MMTMSQARRMEKAGHVFREISYRCGELISDSKTVAGPYTETLWSCHQSYVD